MSCSPAVLVMAPLPPPQYQHAETSRIPKQGGPEGPPAGGFALWELWLYHGLSSVCRFDRLQPPPPSSFLLHRRPFCSQLLLLLDEQGKSLNRSRSPFTPVPGFHFSAFIGDTAETDRSAEGEPAACGRLLIPLS